MVWLSVTVIIIGAVVALVGFGMFFVWWRNNITWNPTPAAVLSNIMVGFYLQYREKMNDLSLLEGEWRKRRFSPEPNHAVLLYPLTVPGFEAAATQVEKTADVSDYQARNKRVSFTVTTRSRNPKQFTVLIEPSREYGKQFYDILITRKN